MIKKLSALYVGAAFVLVGCGSDPQTETVTMTTIDETSAEAPTSETPRPDQPVNPLDYERPGTEMSVFTYTIEGSEADCAISSHGVTCQVATPSDAPMVTAVPLEPQRANAIYIGNDGMHWTLFEGVGRSQGELNPGQSITVDGSTCAYPEEDVLECSSRGDSFTISGSDHRATLNGNLVDTPVWTLPEVY